MEANVKHKTMKAAIKAVATYLPEHIIYNHQIEERIHNNTIMKGNNMLERLFGSKTRRFASEEMQVSDLACAAAKKIIHANTDATIDLLIFAAASSDLIEPATANIVQHKLGLACPVMDVKNACNSFVSAIHVGSAFIESGIYNNVLIACGEKLSEVINYSPMSDAHLNRCISAFTLGDAGAAMLLGKSDRGKIVYQNFNSFGAHWDLCTVMGGGSLAYRNFDKYYFECDSKALRSIFQEKTGEVIFNALRETGWNINEIACIIPHQISSGTTSIVSKGLALPEDRFINIFSKYGNVAAATIPLALHEAITGGRLKTGEKLMLLGMAAGISLSVQLIEW
ncbi:MAG TPA: ketoacyl-ACP synthase III [Agriterribacter sp.]|nr:ketoacyl-ACP synthase III [Agriterribacter sp.]HRQ49259.1 ketoacyl-ACP synthase III [Agriterribacter sp.]